MVACRAGTWASTKLVKISVFEDDPLASAGKLTQATRTMHALAEAGNLKALRDILQAGLVDISACSDQSMGQSINRSIGQSHRRC